MIPVLDVSGVLGVCPLLLRRRAAVGVRARGLAARSACGCGEQPVAGAASGGAGARGRACAEPVPCARRRIARLATGTAGIAGAAVTADWRTSRTLGSCHRRDSRQVLSAA